MTDHFAPIPEPVVQGEGEAGERLSADELEALFADDLAYDNMHSTWARQWLQATVERIISAHVAAQLAADREAIAQAILDVASDDPMWIDDDEEPLEFCLRREFLIGEFMYRAADAVIAALSDDTGSTEGQA